MSRWRVKRVAVSPEEIGLCGAWQVIAVERTRIERAKAPKKEELPRKKRGRKKNPPGPPAPETGVPAETKENPAWVEKKTVEIGCYITSLTEEEITHDELLALIRGHWSAIENGTHYRRDVTLGEDACRVAHRIGAEVLASLRNLALGLYELQRARGKTKVDTLASWCQRQTFSKAWAALRQT